MANKFTFLRAALSFNFHDKDKCLNFKRNPLEIFCKKQDLLNKPTLLNQLYIGHSSKQITLNFFERNKLRAVSQY